MFGSSRWHTAVNLLSLMPARCQAPPVQRRRAQQLQFARQSGAKNRNKTGNQNNQKSKEPSFLFMLTTQQPLCSNAKRHFDPFRVNVISGGLLWTSQKVKLLLLYTKLCTCLRAPLMQHATGCESRSAGLAVPSPNQHCCGKLSDNLNHSESI